MKQTVKKSLAVLFISMLLTPILSLLLSIQADVVVASPGPDIENLWVNSYDVNVQQWKVVGASPYLNTQDQPNNYVYVKPSGKEIGYFHFSDLSGSFSINSVTFEIYIQQDTIGVSIWDGLTWTSNSLQGPQSGWGWSESWDVTSILNTTAKINATKIYLTSETNNTYADAAYLEVDYTIPPPEKPTLLGPENGVTTSDTMPTFSWENGEYAENHRIEVDSDTDWGNGVVDNETSLTNTWSGGEYGVGTYYWRVWAVNSTDENVSENVWEFTIMTWWDVDWANRRKIEINPMNPENYQLKIFFDNLSGMKSDLSDLRFLENIGTGVLSYWIENYTNDNATVWVRRLENVDNSIYVYYANPSAESIENGDNTFIFFDDFPGAGLDAAKWTTHSGSPIVSGSILTLDYDGDQDISTIGDYTLPVIFRGYGLMEGSNYGWFGMGAGNGSSPFVSYWHQNSHYTRTNNGIANEDAASSKPAGIWYTYEIRLSATNQDFYLDNVVDVQQTMDFSGVSDIKIAIDARDGGGRIDTDWVLMRKFAISEPVTTVGEQEPPPVRPTKPILYYPGNGDVITDETPRFEWTKGLNVDYHKLLVSLDNNFTSIVENENIIFENNYTILPDNFLSDGTYWWHVEARSENGENISDDWSFKVKAVSVFEASSGVDKLWTYASENMSFEAEMSPDGELIALGEYGGWVRVFGRIDNIPLWENYISGTDEAGVGALSFSDDGQYLAAGTETGYVRFYDNAENGNILWTSADKGSIQKRTVTMSPDGEYVIAGTIGGEVLLFKGIGGDGSTEWEYDTGVNTKIWETTISPLVDGTYRAAAVGQDHHVHFWDNVEENTPEWSYETGYWTMAVDISDGGDRIVVGSWDNYIYFFDNAFTDSTYLWRHELTDNTYHAERHMWFTATISDDGQYIAAGIDQQEGWYYLFDNSGNVLWEYSEFGQEVRDVKISGDGSRIVGGGWGGRVYNWNRDDNVPIWVWGDTTFRPFAIAISEDGSLVAVSEWKYFHLMQDGSFGYELKTEGQIRPYRVLTTTPEFSFKLPSRKVENTIAFRIAVGENVLDVDNLMWNPSSFNVESEENEVYYTYAGRILHPYTTYQWRVRLRDNENNWSPWSVTRSFEITELTDFTYYRTLSFTENIPDNYQVKIVIDNVTNMDENFKDLLFYDGAYPNVGLPYWIENVSENIVWAKVHDNGNIRMYYSNDNAQDASYGDDTFPDLFDNFDGPDISVAKWLIYGLTNQPSISDGVVTLSSATTQFLEAGMTYGTNLALRTRAYIQDSSDNLYIGFAKIMPISGADDTPPSAHFWGTSGNIYLRTALSGYNETTSSASTDYLDTYTIYELKRIGTDNVELWANDDNLVLSNDTNISTARITVYLQPEAGGDSLKIDWVLLRKSMAIEPIVTIENEQTWDWRLIENWSGIVETPVGWELIEQWSGTVQAGVAWQLIETWTGTIEALVAWELIETWTGTVETVVAWQLIETWTGTVEAFAQWELVETWTGVIEAPAEWQLIETWTGVIEVGMEWQLIEDWSGMVQNPQIPTGWILIETWTGALLTVTLYGNIFIISPWSDGRVNPTDVTTATPGFSAIYVVVDNSNPNQALSIHIQVGTSLDENDLWDNIATVTVENGQRSIDVDYDGTDLILNTSYWWRSRFGDSFSNWTEWTLPQTFGYEDEPFDFFAAAMFIFPIVLMAIALLFDSPIFASFAGIVFIFSGLFFVDTLWLAVIFIGLGVYLLITAFFADWED